MDRVLSGTAGDFEDDAGPGQDPGEDIEDSIAITGGGGCDAAVGLGVIVAHGASPDEVLASVSVWGGRVKR
jgi:hypothetical protein